MLTLDCDRQLKKNEGTNAAFNYSDIAEAALGRGGRLLSNLSIFLTLVGVSAS